MLALAATDLSKRFLQALTVMQAHGICIRRSRRAVQCLAERVDAHAAQRHRAAAAVHLRMFGPVIVIFADRIAAKSERIAWPVDGGMRIALAQSGNDGTAVVR